MEVIDAAGRIDTNAPDACERELERWVVQESIEASERHVLHANTHFAARRCVRRAKVLQHIRVA